MERPSEAELARLREAVRHADPDAIAISFLFSFANPENEAGRSCGRGGTRQTAFGVSSDSAGVPRIRTHQHGRSERLSATAHAELHGKTVGARDEHGSWLRSAAPRSRKARALRGTRKPRSLVPRIFVMQSSGGITALESAAREPVRTVLSGPAGGLVGAAAMAAAAGSGRFSPSTWGGPRPMWPQSRVRFEPAANRKWPGFRWEFPCSRFTPWAPEAARWLASMPAARCAWDRNRRAPIRDRSATVAEPNPR